MRHVTARLLLALLLALLALAGWCAPAAPPPPWQDTLHKALDDVMGGHLDEAKQLLLKVIAMQEKALGPNAYEVAQSYFMYGRTCYEELQVEPELTAYAKAVAICGTQRTFTDEKLNDMTYVLGTIADAYARNKGMPAGQAVLQGFVQTVEAATGKDGAAVMVPLGELCDFCTRNKLYADAQAALDRMAANVIARLGADAPEMALVYHRMGELASRRKSFSDAEIAFA
jgi:hypothetical protein